jgi:hypothetical protein
MAKYLKILYEKEIGVGFLPCLALLKIFEKNKNCSHVDVNIHFSNSGPKRGTRFLGKSPKRNLKLNRGRMGCFASLGVARRLPGRLN